MQLFIRYFDIIAMFLAGVSAFYIGGLANRPDVADKMDPVRRQRLMKRMRLSGKLLIIFAVLLAILKALLAS